MAKMGGNCCFLHAGAVDIILRYCNTNNYFRGERCFVTKQLTFAAPERVLVYKMLEHKPNKRSTKT